VSLTSVGTSIASPGPIGLSGSTIGGIVGGILGAVLLIALGVIIYILKKYRSKKISLGIAVIDPEGGGNEEELTGTPGVEDMPNLETIVDITPGARLRYPTQDVITGGRLANAV
jgi:hypothetical protein